MYYRSSRRMALALNNLKRVDMPLNKETIHFVLSSYIISQGVMFTFSYCQKTFIKTLTWALVFETTKFITNDRIIFGESSGCIWRKSRGITQRRLLVRQSARRTSEMLCVEERLPREMKRKNMRWRDVVNVISCKESQTRNHRKILFSLLPILELASYPV